MANTSLPDLTKRTATADSDLIHVNSGGSDYKQTKANFLADYVSEIEFNNTSLLTTQVDALPVGSYGGAYTGKISSYGHQSETGVPENDNYTVEVSAFSSQNKRITIMSVLSDKTYTKTKLSGTWGSWILVPRRDEISALNNSLTNSLFVDTYNKTSYSFPVTPPSGSFGYFLLFGGTTSADTSNVFLFVGMVANSNVQFVRLCGTQKFTGTISNGVCTITSSNTVWGGIRVISIN